ncbi:MAG: NUDIX domain-containing protein [Candidatus Kapabacteria bacterium]|nr:NUDIX domain-containing protein [Candidatus Kapabacteria bacterium]
MATVVSSLVQVHVVRRNATEAEWEHLLLRRSVSEAVYPLLWQVVTGTIRSSETAVHAASRELIEETALTAEAMYVLPTVSSFYSQHADSIVHVPVFGAFVSAEASVTLSHEHSEYRWAKATDAVNTLVIPAQQGATRLFESLIHTVIGTQSFDSIYKIDAM